MGDYVGANRLKQILQKIKNLLAKVATSGSYNDLSDTPSLSTVATSGSYNDLSNKPTIPTISAKGSATNPVYISANNVATACTYELNKTVPSNAVFTDTTYSSKSATSGGTEVSLCTTGEKYTWNNKTSNTGTVTSVAVKMNGSTKGTITSSGTIDLGTVITAHQDISGKMNTDYLKFVTQTGTTNSNGCFTLTTYSGYTPVCAIHNSAWALSQIVRNNSNSDYRIYFRSFSTPSSPLTSTSITCYVLYVKATV